MYKYCNNGVQVSLLRWPRNVENKMKLFACPDWKTIKNILTIAFLSICHFHPNIQDLDGVPVTPHTYDQFHHANQTCILRRKCMCVF